MLMNPKQDEYIDKKPQLDTSKSESGTRSSLNLGHVLFVRIRRNITEVI